jgi:hypothetical protein
LHAAELVEIIVQAGWGDALHKYGIIKDHMAASAYAAAVVSTEWQD